MSCTIIIGSGAAAYECAKAMVEENYEGEIHVFSDTNRAPYNPMLTTYYAVGKLNFSGMFPYGEGEEVWSKLGVIFHPNTPVTKLDAINKTVTTHNNTYSYDNCVIATGATPIVPPFPGHNSKKLFTVRTVEDAEKLFQASKDKPKRVIVVGASMVGIKVVELFDKVGSQVCLVDLAPRIFPLAAHPECSKEIEARLAKMGIKLRFGSKLTSIEDTKDGVRVHFEEENNTEDGDIIILCIGVRANIGFVDKTQVETEQGILINNNMQTNVPSLYAVGDVAQGFEVITGKKRIIGLWASARMQGRCAGQNIAGGNATYEGNIMHNITHFMNMDFVGLGEVSNYTHMEVNKTDDKLEMLFWDNDKLIGANYLDNFLDSGVLHTALVADIVKRLNEQDIVFGNEHTRRLYELLEKK
ncbi:hypothetical protein AN639_07195 [Candidatus Epulonipiscium fishelsonii]|uniref:Uncharacterized protein n=1 Tax=Candidatus Epulonipiscium fishelsonii TaxID=77094 RepID=A0ACC8X9W8_9FIRM|nr:hypothetical protein AN639_07195 [Epulopiscium sp. SCG-B05WGA-EpuloA1]ONI39036.1 hypothetical protein AN396_09175 [Epulopiscium sp. SCG-B11WGA-EpuloA1]